jgi:hypothetical protein
MENARCPRQRSYFYFLNEVLKYLEYCLKFALGLSLYSPSYLLLVPGFLIIISSAVALDLNYSLWESFPGR